MQAHAAREPYNLIAVDNSENTVRFYAAYKNGKLQVPNGVLHVEESGAHTWWHDGVFHRIDGPAYIHADGKEEWFVHGLYHRIDGPAIEFSDGSEAWICRNKLHRIGGPAIVNFGGVLWHNLQGIEYRALSNAVSKDGVIAGMYGVEVPMINREIGAREWWLHGLRHCLTGPAIEYADGTREWWVDGMRHRDDGPAIERADGTREWYRDGRLLY